MANITITGIGEAFTGTTKSLEKLLQAYIAALKDTQHHVRVTINRSSIYDDEKEGYDIETQYTISVTSNDAITTKTKDLLVALIATGKQTATGEKESSL